MSTEGESNPQNVPRPGRKMTLFFQPPHAKGMQGDLECGRCLWSIQNDMENGGIGSTELGKPSKQATTTPEE